MAITKSDLIKECELLVDQKLLDDRNFIKLNMKDLKNLIFEASITKEKNTPKEDMGMICNKCGSMLYPFYFEGDTYIRCNGCGASKKQGE